MNIIKKEFNLILGLSEHKDDELDYIINNLNKQEKKDLDKIIKNISNYSKNEKLISEESINNISKTITKIVTRYDGGKTESLEIDKHSKNQIKKIKKISEHITKFEQTTGIINKLSEFNEMKTDSFFTWQPLAAFDFNKDLVGMSLNVGNIKERALGVRKKEFTYSKEKFGENLINYLKRVDGNNSINDFTNAINSLKEIKSKFQKENVSSTEKKQYKSFFKLLDTCLENSLKLELCVNEINDKFGDINKFISLVDETKHLFKKDGNVNEEINNISSEEIKKSSFVFKYFIEFSNILSNITNDMREINSILKTGWDTKYDKDLLESNINSVDKAVSFNETNDFIYELVNETKKLSILKESIKKLSEKNDLEEINNIRLNFQKVYFSSVEKINQNLKNLKLEPIPITSDEFLTNFFQNKILENFHSTTSEINSNQSKLSRKESFLSHSYYFINKENKTSVIRKFHKNEKIVGEQKIKTEETYIKEGGVNKIRKFGVSLSDQTLYISRTPKSNIKDKTKNELLKQAKIDVELFKDSEYIFLPQILSYKSKNVKKEVTIYPFIPFEFGHEFSKDKNPKDVAGILVGIANGIQEMHRKNCVHFDIKEPNILIQERNKKEFHPLISDIDGRVEFGPEGQKKFQLMATEEYLPKKWKALTGKDVTMNLIEGKYCDIYAYSRIIRGQLKYLKNEKVEQALKQLDDDIENNKVDIDSTLTQFISLLEKV